MQQAAQLVGLPVVTFDDRPVGAVEASEPGRVCIRPRRGSPYWIDEVLVRSVAGDHARLHVDARTLERYRQPGGCGRKETGWFQRTTVSAASLVSVALAGIFFG